MSWFLRVPFPLVLQISLYSLSPLGQSTKSVGHLPYVLIQVIPILSNTVGTEAKGEERILWKLVLSGTNMGVEEGA